MRSPIPLGQPERATCVVQVIDKVYLPVLENIEVHLVCDVSLDEGAGRGPGTRIEGMIVGYIQHLVHPIRVEMRNVLHTDHLAMAAKSLYVSTKGTIKILGMQNILTLNPM